MNDGTDNSDKGCESRIMRSVWDMLAESRTPVLGTATAVLCMTRGHRRDGGQKRKGVS